MRPDLLTMLGCAELVCLLVSADDVRICCKRATQLTAGELERLKNGLRTDVCLDALLFVPASSLLLWAISPAFPAPLAVATAGAYAPLLGIASYGFPFKIVRAIVVRGIQSAIKEFASVMSDAVLKDAEEHAVLGDVKKR